MYSLCVILLVLGVATFGLAQDDNTNLLCYDCDSINNPEQCAQPMGSGLPQVNCNAQITNRDANSTLLCLSTYLTFTGEQANRTGLYRGCRSQNSSVVNFCDWFKEETTTRNIILTSCVTCNSSRCNNITFNANGQPNGNGSSLVQTALTVLLISLFFAAFF